MKTIYWIEGPWLGQVSIVARPRGNEWLEDEIKQWRRNGIDVVVSLLPPREREELGLTQEAAMSANHGIQFFSFPITDRSVPSSLREVRALVENLTALLFQGKNLAIHCRQGIGRSALLVASLLVNAGIDVNKAFRQIESARGVVVPDTPEQRQWVEKFANVTVIPALLTCTAVGQGL